MPLPHETPLDNEIDWVAEHTHQYINSNGADGHDWRGATCLVLTTLGRSSGKLRHNPLIYVEDGDSYVVVGSFGGKPHHPDWYLNMVDHPEVRIQVRDKVMDAIPETLSGGERARIWPACVEMWPSYTEYQEKTSREFPVVRLTPTGSA